MITNGEKSDGINIGINNQGINNQGINNQGINNEGINNEGIKNQGINKEEKSEGINKEENRKIKLYIIPKIDQKWSVLKIATEGIHFSWKSVFENAYPELENISEILEKDERIYGEYFPLKKDLFKAFELTRLNRVKVVLVGQDPYPQYRMDQKPRAQGLSFSVSRNDEIPSSLQNIYKELETSISGFKRPDHGDLTGWAKQGVLLLNMNLTVRPNSPDSHGKLWLGFTVKVLEAIMEKRKNVIFILLGKNAQYLTKYLGEKVSILMTSHPSGFSANRGFFGSNIFANINEILSQKGEIPINWSDL